MTQLMIVRRGQTGRYRSLEETFGREPVGATVMWDRRELDRRAIGQSIGDERRRRERRGVVPSTWKALDFIVVKPDQGAATEPAAPSPAHHPVDGDVLIRREVGPRGPCTVNRVPDAAASLYGTYDGALQQGDAMAEQTGVDLWYTEDHQTFKVLRSYRRSSRTA